MASMISQPSNQKGVITKNYTTLEEKEDISDSNDPESESKTVPNEQKPNE